MRERWLTAAALLVLVGVAAAVHLFGIRRDLPYGQEIDELLFVSRAVHVAALADPDPGWFGNPGTTMIYALAATYRLRRILEGGPVRGPDPVLLTRFVTHSEEFYLTGRLVNVAFALASIVLTYVVGRRAFGAPVGLLATFLFLLEPLAIDHAQMVRSDTSATCFGLLALWLCLRLHDRPGIAGAIGAGLAIGVAVASRYFMVVLVAALLAVYAPLWRRRELATRWMVIGLLAVPVGFALATPYFFLHFSAVLRDLAHEAKTAHPGADGLSPLGNLLWYLGNAIPGAMGWPIAALAGLGATLALVGRGTKQVALVVFVGVFVVATSTSSLHWARWMIQILPVLAMLAASAASRIGGWLDDRFGRRPALRMVVVGCALLVLLAPPALRTAAFAMQFLEPSTRVQARAWTVAHVPRRTRIAQEYYTAALDGAGYDVTEKLSLATDRTLEDYAREGYGVLMVSEGVWWRYLADPARHPDEVRFYSRLFETGRLLQEIRPSKRSRGSVIRIYALDGARVP